MSRTNPKTTHNIDELAASIAEEEARINEQQRREIDATASANAARAEAIREKKIQETLRPRTWEPNSDYHMFLAQSAAVPNNREETLRQLSIYFPRPNEFILEKISTPISRIKDPNEEKIIPVLQHTMRERGKQMRLSDEKSDLYISPDEPILDTYARAFRAYSDSRDRERDSERQFALLNARETAEEANRTKRERQQRLSKTILGRMQLRLGLGVKKKGKTQKKSKKQKKSKTAKKQNKKRSKTSKR